jgi:hypothetical protein
VEVVWPHLSNLEDLSVAEVIEQFDVSRDRSKLYSTL